MHFGFVIKYIDGNERLYLMNYYYYYYYKNFSKILIILMAIGYANL